MKSLSLGSIAAVVLIPLTRLLSQDADVPTPTEEETQSRNISYVRVWSMLPAEVPPVEFGAFPSLKDRISLEYSVADGASTGLLGRVKPYALTGYQEIEPGSFELKLVKRAADQEVELARQRLRATAGKFATVIISKSDTGYDLSVYRDEKPEPPPSADGKPPPPAKEIVFFNMLPGTSAAVKSTKPPIAMNLPYGTVEKLSELPPGLFMLSTQGTANGAPFSSETEIDLNTYDSLSYLLVEDRYGRVTAALVPNAEIPQ